MSVAPESSLQLWLPALAAMDATHPLRTMLARADRLPDASRGYLGGLNDYFSGLDANLPAAPLTRELLAGDAGDHLWLSADPAWVQPDLNGVRLLACGKLQLEMDEAQAFAESLQPVFDEAGFALHVSSPDRWHLRLPPGTTMPALAAPEQALGEDLSQHLPQGQEGRSWRILLNEIQVLLHQHPQNAERSMRGLPPINSLWLWGGGQLPHHVESRLLGVISDDVLLRALARRAGLPDRPRVADTVTQSGRGWLIDLQDLPSMEIASAWWATLQKLFERQSVTLHFADGSCWRHKPWHRWRFWRGAGR